MNTLPLRILLVTALGVVQPALHSQSQNPISAARDAFKKVMEDAKRQAQGQATPEPAQAGPDPSALSGPAAAQSGSRLPGSPPGSSSVRQTGDAPAAATSAQETARLAASLAYLDVAGVKLGAPLSEAQKAMKGNDPRYTFRPTVEFIWPGSQPPPDAPKSVVFLQAELRDGSVTEAFSLNLARHPNPPVVISIERQIGYPNNSGTSFDNLVAGLRKKYGPESTIDPNAANNNNQRNFAAKWYFDERGQVLSGNLGAQVAASNCRGVGMQPTSVGLCGTLTILEVHVSASGAGVVNGLRVQAKSNPLEFSAHQTTQAFLRLVQQGAARQQLQESSQRQGPKL